MTPMTPMTPSASPRRLRRVAGLVGVVLAGTVTITGCSTTLADVPLPGVGVSGDTVTVDVQFAEALNLARGATVKVNGVDSGKVQEVSAEDFHAKVEMKVKKSAALREGASYRLRYTTPLGELFVDVTNPTSGPLVTSGSTIELDDTSTAPTVEDALSQASLLINGGGFASLQDITEELNTALGGREDTARRLLERSRTFLVQANATTTDIDRALRSLSSVSKTLSQRQDIINRAVREITPAAKVLKQNEPGLTKLLAEVRDFAATANDTVSRTGTKLLNVIRRAEPILAEFAGNKPIYPASLKALISLGGVVSNIVPGDYASISVAANLLQTHDLELDDVLQLLGIKLPLVDGLPAIPNPLLSLTGLISGGHR